MLKLSIITVNLNNLGGLKKTMQSVFEQTFTDYEYIIIDGESTDGSKEYIEMYSSKLAYWVSEKDSGIYQAMNKGIRKAEGKYLLFLNSGDFLFNSNALSDFIFRTGNEDIVYGCQTIDNNGKYQKKTYPAVLRFSFFFENTLPHQSTLIKRELFDRVGLYNESIKSTSDWIFFMNAVCKFNAKYKYVEQPLSVFDTNGITSQLENWEWIKKDKEMILENEYSAFLDDYRVARKNMQELTLIKNSRWWKLRNRVRKLPIIKHLLS